MRRLLGRAVPFPEPPLGWLVAAVIGGGVGVLVLAGLSWEGEDPLFLGALVGLTLLCERFDFALPTQSRVSISVAFVLAAGIVSGVPGVAVVAAACAAGDGLAHRKPWYKAAYNLGVLLLAGAPFVGVFEAFGGGYRAEDWPLAVLPALVGAGVNFALNSALVALAIALSTGERPQDVWAGAFRWLLPHYLLMGLLAATLALAYDRWEMAGLALLLVPLAAMWAITREQVDRAFQVGPPAPSAGR